jgi:hypothetical protein
MGGGIAARAWSGRVQRVGRALGLLRPATLRKRGARAASAPDEGSMHFGAMAALRVLHAKLDGGAECMGPSLAFVRFAGRETAPRMTALGS